MSFFEIARPHQSANWSKFVDDSASGYIITPSRQKEISKSTKYFLTLGEFNTQLLPQILVWKHSFIIFKIRENFLHIDNRLDSSTITIFDY